MIAQPNHPRIQSKTSFIHILFYYKKKSKLSIIIVEYITIICVFDIEKKQDKEREKKNKSNS